MKASQWKTPILLSILLGVLGTSVYWLEFSALPKKEEKEEAAKLLFQLDGKQLSAIEWTQEKLQFEILCTDQDKARCKPGERAGWTIKKPLVTQADLGNIESLLSTLKNLASEQVIDLSTETPENQKRLLAEYRLDPETLAKSDTKKLELSFSDGKKVTLFLGAPHPLGDRQFALIQNSSESPSLKIRLLAGTIKGILAHDLNYWRNKQVFDFNSQDVSEFTYRNKEGQIHLQRQDKDWLANKLPGEPDSIEALLANVGHLHAKGVAYEDHQSSDSKKLLADAKEVAFLSMKVKEKTVELRFLEKSQGKSASYFGIGSESRGLWEFDGQQKATLVKALKDFRRSRLLSSNERLATSEIRVTDLFKGAVILNLKKNDGSWTAPELIDLDSNKVVTLLEKLGQKQIRDFIGKQANPNGNGIQLVLLDATGQELRKFQFWRGEGHLYGKDFSTKNGETLLMLPDLTSLLPWTKDDFKKKEGEKAADPLKDLPKNNS